MCEDMPYVRTDSRKIELDPHMTTNEESISCFVCPKSSLLCCHPLYCYTTANKYKFYHQQIEKPLRCGGRGKSEIPAGA